MPLDFPSNPQLNDTYSFGGKTWRWNGNAWQLAATGAINDIPIGNITASTGNFTTLSVTTGVSSNLVPTANVTYDLGTANLRWNQLFLAGNTIDLGGAIMKSDPVEGTIALIPRVRPGETATKAIVIGQQGIATVNTDVNGIVSAEDLQAAAINPNTTTTNLFVSSTASVTGNITGGNITISGKIQGTVSSGTITLTQPGNITSPFTGVSRFYPLANLVVNNVFASLGTTSSDQFSFRLNKNGSNVGPVRYGCRFVSGVRCGSQCSDQHHRLPHAGHRVRHRCHRSAC